MRELFESSLDIAQDDVPCTFHGNDEGFFRCNGVDALADQMERESSSGLLMNQPVKVPCTLWLILLP